MTCYFIFLTQYLVLRVATKTQQYKNKKTVRYYVKLNFPSMIELMKEASTGDTKI